MASTGQAVPPLLRTVWVRVDTGAGAVAELSSRTRERVLLRTHLQLDGQLVRAGDTVTVPGVGIGGAMGTASVIRVSSNASGAPAAKGKGSTQPPSVGRMTARTEVHIEKTRAAALSRQLHIGGRGPLAASDEDAPTVDGDAAVPGIFPAQQRGYDAVCALLHAATPPQSEALAAWRVRPPSGVLLSGPPGTGKTHLVRAAAKAFGAPLVAFSGAAGGGDDEAGNESGARLRAAFVRAEGLAREASAARGQAVPAILFLDELDGYCPSRAESGVSDEAIRCVAVLLTLLDGLGARHGRVLAVAASNRPDALDAALRRPGRLEWEVLQPTLTAHCTAAACARCTCGRALALTSVSHGGRLVPRSAHCLRGALCGHVCRYRSHYPPPPSAPSRSVRAAMACRSTIASTSKV